MENKFDIGQFVPVLTLEQARCDLVNRFHSRRKELHYSQRKLSAISGVSYGSIRRFENTGEIALSSLLRLADVMSDSLFAQKDPNRPVTSALAIGSAGIRILIYAIVLVVSGICTFKSAWFGGFNAFNFYTTAAGLLPMLAVIFLTQFFAIKKENSAPQGSGAQPSSEANKDSSQDEKK